MNKTHVEIVHIMLKYNRLFKSFMKAELSDTGINHIEALTLHSLKTLKGRSAEKLLETVSCDKSVMTRALQHLEKEGLVTRNENPADGRSWLFSITEKGMTAADKVTTVFEKWSRLTFDGLTESEASLFLELLKKTL